MSASKRRLAGLLIAIAIIIGGVSYTSWRLLVVGREGWAGLAYMPDVKPRKGEKPPPTIGGFRPGMIFMIYPGSPADRAGMTRMSHIVSINGIQIGEIKEITRLSEKVRRGDIVTYRTVPEGVEHGAERDYRVRFESPTQSTVFIGVLATTSLVALVFLLIGTFVFWRLPTDGRAVVFFAMTVFAAVSFIAATIAGFESGNMRGFAIEAKSAAPLARPAVLGLASLFFAPLLLHLSLIFPKPRPVVARGRTLFTWIYGFPLYFGACAIVFLVFFQLLVTSAHATSKVAFLSFWWVIAAVVAATAALSLLRVVRDMRRKGAKEGFVTHPLAFMTIVLGFVIGGMYLAGVATDHMHNPVPIFIFIGIVALLFLFSFISYPVATLIALFRSYRASGVEERRQVKWPLWGTMIAVGVKIVLTLIGVTLGLLVTFGGRSGIPSIINVIPDLLSRIVYIIVPVSFAFAILKYRLMNIDVIIRRTVLYSIFTAVIFVLYAVLVAGVGTALVKFAGLTSQTMLVASTVVIALAAVPLRNRLQRMVDRNLFRERRDYPVALRNIGNAIAASQGIDDFLRSCMEQTQQALQNRFVLIAIRRDRDFVAAAKVGLADEILGNVRVPADVDLTTVPEPFLKLGATLVIPVRTHRESVALLVLGSKLSDEDFSPEDFEFLNAAASQIAVGIENLRLRDEEVEFEQARAMQQILLPTRFPQLEGIGIAGMWQPARSVGGDYFDTLALGNGKAAICIGDVAGKGMSAALLMANLQAAVKATASATAAPATVCERVKEIVGGNLSGGKFISFFYGLIDTKTRNFAYSNAGHNPPILVRADGTVERLARGGPAMSRLFKGIPHEQDVVTLAAGDRIVLFTDGASEARRGEDEFGDDRLIQLLLRHRHLSARELLERILEELRDFTAGDFSDDVTLVVVAVDQ